MAKEDETPRTNAAIVKWTYDKALAESGAPFT
jgi:hypothetical protein